MRSGTVHRYSPSSYHPVHLNWVMSPSPTVQHSRRFMHRATSSSPTHWVRDVRPFCKASPPIELGRSLVFPIAATRSCTVGILYGVIAIWVDACNGINLFATTCQQVNAGVHRQNDCLRMNICFFHSSSLFVVQNYFLSVLDVQATRRMLHTLSTKVIKDIGRG